MGSQSINGVVGDRDCLFFVAIRNDYQHWSEDFLASDAHVRPNLGKNRRLCERSLDLDLLDVPVRRRGASRLHRFPPGSWPAPAYTGRDGPHGGRRIPRVADADGARGIAGQTLDFGEPMGGYEHARRGAASLADIAHAGKDAFRYRLDEIGVIEQDVG